MQGSVEKIFELERMRDHTHMYMYNADASTASWPAQPGLHFHLLDRAIQTCSMALKTFLPAIYEPLHAKRALH